MLSIDQVESQAGEASTTTPQLAGEANSGAAIRVSTLQQKLFEGIEKTTKVSVKAFEFVVGT